MNEVFADRLCYSFGACDHEFGDLEGMSECVRSCWHSTTQVHDVGQQGPVTTITVPGQYDRDSSIHGAIISAISNLEFTGAVTNGFHAYWPFADTPGLYTVPISRDENAWIDLMPNSSFTSCLAVMSFRCFEYYYSDRRGNIARTCPGRYKVHNQDQYPLGCDAGAHKRQRISSTSPDIDEIAHQRLLFPPESAQPRGRDYLREVELEGTPTKAPRQANCTFFRTRIQLNPSTPVNKLDQRDERDQVILSEGETILMGELPTLKVIRSNDRGIQLATLKSGGLGKIKSALKGTSAHKESFDPSVNSGNIVELCITEI